MQNSTPGWTNILPAYWKYPERVQPTAFAHRFPHDDIIAAFEPTTDYHRNIAWWLHNQGVQCHLVSSVRCAQAREMLFKTLMLHLHANHCFTMIIVGNWVPVLAWRYRYLPARRRDRDALPGRKSSGSLTLNNDNVTPVI